MSEGLNVGLPALGSVEALRFAADVVEATVSPDDPFPAFVPRSADALRIEADRVEREQAEKAKHDALIEQAARVIHGAYGREWCDADGDSRRLNYARARALADAGLLKSDGGCTR